MCENRPYTSVLFSQFYCKPKPCLNIFLKDNEGNLDTFSIFYDNKKLLFILYVMILWLYF